MDVIELFAGVGGFRVGFDRVNALHPNEEPFYETIWSNQFEPLVLFSFHNKCGLLNKKCLLLQVSPIVSFILRISQRSQ